MLADKIRHYQEEKKMLKNTPAGYKKEYPWLKEVDSLALANAGIRPQYASYADTVGCCSRNSDSTGSRAADC